MDRLRRPACAHLSDERRAWRRSSVCATSGCLEVRHSDGLVLVRDSKDPDGPVLRYTLEEWDAFVAGVKAGEFDHP